MTFTQEESENMYNLLCDMGHAQRVYDNGGTDTLLSLSFSAIESWYVDHCDDEAKS
jgi:hypothetical protein